LKKTKGSIINIGSIGGLVGYAGGIAYCASKAAVVMMSKTSALELASYGIRVNCIRPGAPRTSMIPEDKLKDLPMQIPLKRVGEPEDVAEMALFLASERARQIIGGVHVIDGGITAGRPRADLKRETSPSLQTAAKKEENYHVDSDAERRV
jgi:NAD(P)-dependent dehydrogenase (short-subunit alcohol dehydrogenase family)